MGIKILEQPDGRYAAWSTIIDDFLIEDATEDEIREWYVERKKDEAEREAEEFLERQLGDATQTRGSGPESYEEAVERAE